MAAVGDGNGGHTEIRVGLKDWLKLLIGVITIFGAIMGGLLFIFVTKADAIKEHAAIKLETALHAQVAQLELKHAQQQASKDRDDVKDIKAIVKTLDDTQRLMMREQQIPKRRMAPLPVGITFEGLEP